MRSPLPSQDTDPPPRQLVPDAQVRAELGGVSPMTLHRWDRDPSLGFPRPLIIHGRKYRLRQELEAFKTCLIEASASGAATTASPLDPRRRRAAGDTQAARREALRSAIVADEIKRLADRVGGRS
jgi:hypothetical protein